MHDQYMRKYFFFGLFLLGTVLTVTILWPFAKVIILAIALSAVLFPVYKFFKKYLKTPWVSSLLTVVLFLIVLCIPLFIIGTTVFNQSQNLYAWVADHGGLDNITKVFNRSIQNVFPGGSINLKDSITSVASNFTSSIGSAFTATLTTIFSLFLVLLSMFYFLKDGINWKQILIHFSPLSDESGNKILTKLNGAVNGIVKGYLLIGVVQGILMGVGLAIFGVPNAVLWGLFTAIASLVPTIGTAFVAIPALLFLLIMGKTGAAIGFGIWAVALVGTIDNLLNPYLVGRKIDIHPLLVLFSVLGGIVLMGPIGILIGPLAISFMYALSSVYKTEVKGV
jgi:predicted PurR-regulated permease PerM